MTFQGKRQGDPRTRTVGTSVSPTEAESIIQALRQGGFHHPSHAVRMVLFAYRDSVAVRDAVAEHMATPEVVAS